MFDQRPLRSRGTGFRGIRPLGWAARLAFSLVFLQILPAIPALSATYRRIATLFTCV